MTSQGNKHIVHQAAGTSERRAKTTRPPTLSATTPAPYGRKGEPETCRQIRSEAKELGRRLQYARKEAGLKQAELAAALGERFDHSRISKIEHGHGSMRIDTLKKVAKELEVSTDFLLGLTNVKTPPATLSDELAG